MMIIMTEHPGHIVVAAVAVSLIFPGHRCTRPMKYVRHSLISNNRMIILGEGFTGSYG